MTHSASLNGRPGTYSYIVANNIFKSKEHLLKNIRGNPPPDEGHRNEFDLDYIQILLKDSYHGMARRPNGQRLVQYKRQKFRNFKYYT